MYWTQTHPFHLLSEANAASVLGSHPPCPSKPVAMLIAQVPLPYLLLPACPLPPAHWVSPPGYVLSLSSPLFLRFAARGQASSFHVWTIAATFSRVFFNLAIFFFGWFYFGQNFFFFPRPHPSAYRILVPWPGMEPGSSPVKGWVPTIRLLSARPPLILSSTQVPAKPLTLRPARSPCHRSVSCSAAWGSEPCGRNALLGGGAPIIWEKPPIQFESQPWSWHCKALSSVTPNCPAPQTHLPWTFCLSDNSLPHTSPPLPRTRLLPSFTRAASGHLPELHSATVDPEPWAG